jgi:glycosyltransferase involved in cell wall biosynthesis
MHASRKNCPLKIAMIPTGSFGAVGGPTTYVGALIEELRRVGHHVDVFAWNREHRGQGSPGRLASTSQLLRFLHRSRPDVIHIHSHYRFILPAVIYRIALGGGTRVVFTFHTAPTLRRYLPSAPPRREVAGVMRAAAAGLLRMCDRITSVSGSIVRELNRGCGLNIRSFVTIPSGGKPQPADPARLDTFVASHCLGSSFPVFGTMGVMYLDGKVLGQQRCIEAVDLLRPEFPAIRLLIAGDGPYRGYLEDLVQRRRLREHVTFLGNITSVAEFFNAIEVYAHMSEVEGCPLSVVDALWARRAVVVANRGGMPEIVTDGATGTIVESSAEDLARAIRNLAEDPRKRQELARRGYDYAERHLGWAKIASQYLDQYAA